MDGRVGYLRARKGWDKNSNTPNFRANLEKLALLTGLGRCLEIGWTNGAELARGMSGTNTSLTDLIGKLSDLKVAQDRIREYVIDNDLFRLIFVAEPQAWETLSASMDLLGDTLLALSDFVEHGVGARIGGRYLRLYGFFEAIFLHHDAIRSQHVALTGRSLANLQDSRWIEAREYRHLIAAHPVSSRHDRYAYVTRATIADDFADLLIVSRPGDSLSAQPDYGTKWADTPEDRLVRVRFRPVLEAYIDIAIELLDETLRLLRERCTAFFDPKIRPEILADL